MTGPGKTTHTYLVLEKNICIFLDGLLESLFCVFVFIIVNVGEDCPVFDGLFEFCQLSTGGSAGKCMHTYIQIYSHEYILLVMCCMGLRSGLFAGQSSSSTPISTNHFCMDLVLCMGALSC